MPDLRAAGKTALRAVLRPVARFCLHHGISAPELWMLVKSSFVEEAARQLAADQRRPSRSRAAMMTGLTRPEVAKHWPQPVGSGEEERDSRERLHYGQRLVAAWLRDPDFAGRDAARTLPMNGSGSFEELVVRYGANIPYRSVLAELRSRGIAEECEDGVRLLRHSYIPEGVDPTKVLLMGVNAGRHLDTIERNLRGTQPPLFERKVSFRFLRPAGVNLLQDAAKTEAQALLESLDARLAGHAADAPEADAAHAGLGIYVYVDEASHDEP